MRCRGRSPWRAPRSAGLVPLMTAGKTGTTAAARPLDGLMRMDSTPPKRSPGSSLCLRMPARLSEGRERLGLWS